MKFLQNSQKHSLVGCLATACLSPRYNPPWQIPVTTSIMITTNTTTMLQRQARMGKVS